MNERMSEGLEKVYAAKAADELNAAYGVWSADYDRETLSLGYCLPFVISGWIARYVNPADSALLDAGCGTGLSGPVVRALGFEAVDGLDFSADMLSLATQRGCYRSLYALELGKVLPFGDGHYAAVFSTGVFTEGHAPASSLHELCRITKAGGHVIITVRDVVLERDGFRAVFAELEAANRWRLVEESPPFRAFAIAEPDVLVQAFVFEVL